MKMVNNKKEILVFDIGGTWIRVAIYSSNKLFNIKRFPSINPKQENWLDLINKIINIVNLYKENYNFNILSISLGACINHINNQIYEAAPLLGKQKINFNFQEVIANYLKNEFTVYLINDVSALCYGNEAFGYAKQLSIFASLTISSGIAMRLYNPVSKSPIYDNLYGIQGEVGHITVPNPFFIWNEVPVCDCGAKGHLAAYSSGNGLNKLFKTNIQYDKNYKESILYLKLNEYNIIILALREALKSDCVFSNKILDIIAYPIAWIISTIYCIYPNCEKIFISGGVIECLSSSLINRVYTMLKDTKYIYSDFFYKKKLFYHTQDINLGLIGAGYYASIKEV